MAPIRVATNFYQSLILLTFYQNTPNNKSAFIRFSIFQKASLFPHRVLIDFHSYSNKLCSAQKPSKSLHAMFYSTHYHPPQLYPTHPSYSYYRQKFEVKTVASRLAHTTRVDGEEGGGRSGTPLSTNISNTSFPHHLNFLKKLHPLPLPPPPYPKSATPFPKSPKPRLSISAPHTTS